MNSVGFKVRQKTESDGADCTFDGKPFQTRAAATGNARSPIVVRRIGGTYVPVGIFRLNGLMHPNRNSKYVGVNT